VDATNSAFSSFTSHDLAHEHGRTRKFLSLPFVERLSRFSQKEKLLLLVRSVFGWLGVFVSACLVSMIVLNVVL
jgi:hypothetical protein